MPLKPSMRAIAAVFAALFLIFGSPAGAQTARTFVSGHGTDSGSCPIVAPCRSFAYAIGQTTSGGEILVLDSAGYGAVNITQAVSIVAPPGIEGSISVPAGQNGVTINAGTTDVVTLSGLTIDGNNQGYNGILFYTGGTLNVTRCVIRHFFSTGTGAYATGNGIWMQPISGTMNFIITDTTISDNGYDGIQYYPTRGNANVNGTVDHDVITGNVHDGITFDSFLETAGLQFLSVTNTVSNSNGNYGITSEGWNELYMVLTVDLSQTNFNYAGVAAYASTAQLSRSVITGNTYTGAYAFSGAQLETYGNNQIYNNGCQPSTGCQGGGYNTINLTSVSTQ